MNIVSSDASVLVSPLSACDYDIRVNPNFNNFVLSTQNTPSFALSGLGTPSAKLSGAVKVSNNPSNKITIDSSGLLVLPDTYVNTDETVKIDNGDAVAGYLGGKLIAGANISLTVQNTGGTKRIVIAGTADPAIHAQDTVSLQLLGTGTVDDPLYGNVKISPDSGNSLVSHGNGLFVATPDAGTAETALTATDSSTIDFTTSGTAGHTLTGVVKISATSGNILTNSSGLYVASPLSGTINHLPKFNSTTSIADTAITDDGVILTVPQKAYISGDTGIGVSNTGTQRLAVASSTQIAAITGDNTAAISDASIKLGARMSLTVNNSSPFTQGAAYPASGLYASLGLTNTASLVLKQENIYSALFGFLVGSSTSSITNEAVASVAAKSNFTDNGTYSDVAGMVVFAPDSVVYTGHTSGFTGTITNYYGLLIKSSNSGTINASTMTNKYGIRQQGAGDINLFDGTIKVSNDIEVTANGAGIILKDTGDGTRRRITSVNGVLTVSSPL